MTVSQVTTEAELRTALTEGVVFRVGDVEWAPVECGDCGDLGRVYIDDDEFGDNGWALCHCGTVA